ncbi:hypothetical protein MJO28_009443 [Puccinia striiformis f. sp. tritici]|uniref:Uncharacterized protein n=3 Tax=Puccinia striiformis TaxID=27350 RepID=A0A2S4UFF4_9BASI|nr:hypothetical protein MJO28_009443 [Puccinia striiformis f. sp. tritici]POV95874.1 hypothetical protein PSTT_15974 [Puccinia striiformis]
MHPPTFLSSSSIGGNRNGTILQGIPEEVDQALAEPGNSTDPSSRDEYYKHLMRETMDEMLSVPNYIQLYKERALGLPPSQTATAGSVLPMGEEFKRRMREDLERNMTQDWFMSHARAMAYRPTPASPLQPVAEEPESCNSHCYTEEVGPQLIPNHDHLDVSQYDLSDHVGPEIPSSHIPGNNPRFLHQDESVHQYSKNDDADLKPQTSHTQVRDQHGLIHGCDKPALQYIKCEHAELEDQASHVPEIHRRGMIHNHGDVVRQQPFINSYDGLEIPTGHTQQIDLQGPINYIYHLHHYQCDYAGSEMQSYPQLQSHLHTESSVETCRSCYFCTRQAIPDPGTSSEAKRLDARDWYPSAPGALGLTMNANEPQGSLDRRYKKNKTRLVDATFSSHAKTIWTDTVHML